MFAWLTKSKDSAKEETKPTEKHSTNEQETKQNDEQTQEDEENKVESKRKNENGPFQFHKDTEKNLVDFVKSNAKQNDGASVVQCIDNFCWDRHWMMNIGPDKGKILDIAIKDCKPKYILELGAYCGYSSVRMVATNLNENNIKDTKLYSIEMDEYRASIANQIIEYSGYKDNIKIFNGSTDTMIPNLLKEIVAEDKNFTHFDLVFIDHAKKRYLPDLKMIEECGLVKSGSFVVADNVVVFGLNDYLSYVRNCGDYESKIYESYLEYDKSQKWKDGVEISIRK